MDKRLTVWLLSLAFFTLASLSFAKDSESSNSGSGSNNSESGNSGSGNSQDNDDDDYNDDDDDDGKDDSDVRLDASVAVARGEIISVSKVIQIALQKTPGKIISVQLRHKNHTYVYRIKILTEQGRKREVHVDARSRKIVKVR